MKFFEQHPKQEWKHGPVVDWVTRKYRKEHPTPPRDPWRAIRKLSQQGVLTKVRKGVYKYDPSSVKEVELWDFSPTVKYAIFVANLADEQLTNTADVLKQPRPVLITVLFNGKIYEVTPVFTYSVKTGKTGSAKFKL